MSFSWTTVTQNVTTLAPAIFNQVKTNVDHLTTQLGISAYSWSQLPVATATKVEYVDLTELRSSLDYVHTNNVCATHYTSYLSGDRSGPHNSSYQNNVDTGHYSANQGSHFGSPNYSSYLNSYLSGYQSTYQSSHMGTPHYSSYYSGYQNSNRAIPHYSSNNTSVQTSNRVTHYSGTYFSIANGVAAWKWISYKN